MAETVVDELELVEIGERKAEVGAGAPRPVQFLGQRRVEKRRLPIMVTGSRIPASSER